ATTLRHYQQAGLLTAKSLRKTDNLQIFSRIPTDPDPRRYMPGNGMGDFIVPFMVRKEQLIPAGDPQPIPGHAGIILALSIGFERDPTYVPPREPEPTSTLPVTVAAPSSAPTTRPIKPPQVILQILDSNLNT